MLTSPKQIATFVTASTDKLVLDDNDYLAMLVGNLYLQFVQLASGIIINSMCILNS